jgi:uncharacterized membrane protein YoaK (UPF0700 family)
MMLVLVTGYVDGFGLQRFQTFVSFMSGNTTVSGVQIGEGAFSAAVPTLVAVLFFVGGVLAGALIAVTDPANAHWLSFALVASLIGVFMIADRGQNLTIVAGIAALSAAMGLLNTTVSRIGLEPVNIGYVSGTLNRLADHIARAIFRQPLPGARAPWDTHFRRACLLTGVWTAFLCGAVVSVVVTARYDSRALLVPLIVLAGSALWEWRAARFTAMRL